MLQLLEYARLLGDSHAQDLACDTVATLELPTNRTAGTDCPGCGAVQGSAASECSSA